MTEIDKDRAITTAELDRRLEERRTEDKERRRSIIALVGTVVLLGTLLVSGGVAWATSTSQITQKVDKIEQIKTDAGFDARINVNAMRIDGIQQSLFHLQTSVDSVNLRLRQMACDRKPSSCR